MRQRVPWWLLALLFVGMPLLEIYLLIQVGQVVGAWWTILLLFLAGALGSYLMKHEGGRAWRALQDALASHRMPARELADGALILIGGTLLVTPGFITDLVGLFCVLPFTRPLARRLLTRVLTRRLTGHLVSGGRPGQGTAAPPRAGRQPGDSPPPGTARRPGPTEVIRGEVVDDE